MPSIIEVLHHAQARQHDELGAEIRAEPEIDHPLARKMLASLTISPRRVRDPEPERDDDHEAVIVNASLGCQSKCPVGWPTALVWTITREDVAAIGQPSRTPMIGACRSRMMRLRLSLRIIAM